MIVGLCFFCGGGLFKKFKAASLTKVLIKLNATGKGVVAAFHEADAVMNLPISEAAILPSLHTSFFVSLKAVAFWVKSAPLAKAAFLECYVVVAQWSTLFTCWSYMMRREFLFWGISRVKGEPFHISNRWVARAFYGCQIVNRSNSIPRNGYNFGSDHVLWGRVVVWAFDERDKIQPLHML